MQPNEEMVQQLSQLGFSRAKCVRAAEMFPDSQEAATEWLVNNPDGTPQSSAAPRPEAESSAPDGNTSTPPGWSVVGDEQTNPAAQPAHPLTVLAGHNMITMHDTGDGWVLMSGNTGQPLMFACEESSWFGQLFAGRGRQARWLLLDLQRRPIAAMDKPYAMFLQKATVKEIYGAATQPAEQTAETSGRADGNVGLSETEQGSTGATVESALGSVEQEFDLFKKRVLVTDATPNHAAGTVVIESSGFVDKAFTISLGSTVLGSIAQPRNGMGGVATLTLAPGGLDPFRSNRMRVLLIFGCFLVCDNYWGLSPGPATVVKAGMAGVGRALL